MMSNSIVTMPHRHTVRYEDDDLVIDFEVELLQQGIVFYKKSAKLVKGYLSDTKSIEDQVESWLRSKFSDVEIDFT